jgi:hypothetical protein
VQAGVQAASQKRRFGGIVPREKGLKSAFFDHLEANFVVFPLAGRVLQSDRNARFIALSAGATECIVLGVMRLLG